MAENGDRIVRVYGKATNQILMNINIKDLPESLQRPIEVLHRRGRMLAAAGKELDPLAVDQVYSVLKSRYGDIAAEAWIDYAKKGVAGLEALGIPKECKAWAQGLPAAA
jgi:hypothetical protein